MIALTEKQKAQTYLALLDAWDVKEKDGEDVAKKTAAKVAAYHQDLTRHIYKVAQVLRRARYNQAPHCRHTFWRVELGDVVQIAGHKMIAKLALGLCGYFESTNEQTNEKEWSDCGSVGGPRNDLCLDDYLADDGADTGVTTLRSVH